MPAKKNDNNPAKGKKTAKNPATGTGAAKSSSTTRTGDKSSAAAKATKKTAPPANGNGNGNGMKFGSIQSINTAVKGITDIMRRSNCAGALQYVPELTWILFLRILDEKEEGEALEAAAVGEEYKPSLAAPYRWRDWAAPGADYRYKLQMGGHLGDFMTFVNDDLIPHLKGLRNKSNATPRQRIIGEVMTSVQKVRIDTEKNLLDVLDKVHEISNENVGPSPTHYFTLSQVFEGLLLKMGEKNNDGGQFFTPREVIRAMVRAVDPKVGEQVYDPCAGTGGFLAETYEYLLDHWKHSPTSTPEQLETMKRRTFYGREKDDTAFPIGLANLVLHGIDEPHLWHGNTLTDKATYRALFEGAPALYDVVLTNPPFGGKEGKEAQTRFAFRTGATQVLFLQHVIDSLKPGGRCAIVLDEGVLFRTNETAFVQTKRKLMDDCDLWAIVSLPGGVFTAAGAGVKTDLLFFTKGQQTEKVWYYDLSDIKVNKGNPLTLDRFDDFLRLLPDRADSDRSWTVTRETIEAKNFDLKAVNPNAVATEDTRTPQELLVLIEAKGKEALRLVESLRL